MIFTSFISSPETSISAAAFAAAWAQLPVVYPSLMIYNVFIMMKYNFFFAIIAFVLDYIIGDPYWIPHPVRLFGKLIGLMDKWFNIEGLGKISLRIRGAFLSIILILLTGLIFSTLLSVSFALHPYFYLFIGSFLSMTCVAQKDMRVHAKNVLTPLSSGDLKSAKEALSMIVGRDTDKLATNGVCKATIESVAESTSDGVIAPLFYICLFGPLGGLIYKAINTADSMIGYKNDRYMYFGTFAARLDDIANFIPARICGILMALTSPICGMNLPRAFKILFRDHKLSTSPNSGWPEAAIAGGLGVSLLGDAYYFGKKVSKPAIGDKTREVIPADINKTLVSMYMTSLLFLILMGVIVYAVSGIIPDVSTIFS